MPTGPKRGRWFYSLRGLEPRYPEPLGRIRIYLSKDWADRADSLRRMFVYREAVTEITFTGTLVALSRLIGAHSADKVAKV
jgi:hypothetical protein